MIIYQSFKSVFLLLAIICACNSNENAGSPDDMIDINIFSEINNPIEEIALSENDQYDSINNNEDVEDEAKNKCTLADEVVCFEIPTNCLDSCRKNNKVKFEKVKEIQKFAFKEYIISEQNFDIEFPSLNEIKEDAFNGAILIENSQLNVVINSSSENDQIILKEFAFRGIIMRPGARVNIFINNFKRVEFKENSLNGFKLLKTTCVKITLENNRNVVFNEKSAFKWEEFNENEHDTPMLVVNDKGELENESSGDEQNLQNELANKTKTFLINLTNNGNIKFEVNSFYGLKQGSNTIFQILANNFETAELYENSFSSIEQGDSSKFEVNLHGGNFLKLSENVFEDIKQGAFSEISISFDSFTNSMCVPKNFVKNLQQNKNSILKLSFIGKSNNFYVDGNSFTDLKQSEDSFIAINGHKFSNAYFKPEAFESLVQTSKSIFEIVFIDTSFLIFDNSVFSRVRQGSGSRIRIGLLSNGGTFQQSEKVFSSYEHKFDSQLSYDFSQSTNFNLKFPHIIPRMIVEETSYTNQKLETLYPNLGKLNRPSSINLMEYVLGPEDFCKIANIPSDITVHLASKTECTCPVFYLYRTLRKYNNTKNSWLAASPKCYQDLSKETRLDELELECEFEKLKTECMKNQKEKIILKSDFTCSNFVQNKDDYLTKEIISDDNINLNASGKVENDSFTRQSIFDSTTWIVAITITIILLALTIIILGLFVFMRYRKIAKRNSRKCPNMSNDIDSDNDIEKNRISSVPFAEDSSNVTVEYMNPIYKKSKVKSPSVDSKDYLIENGNNRLTEPERCNLVANDEYSNNQITTKFEKI